MQVTGSCILALACAVPPHIRASVRYPGLAESTYLMYKADTNAIETRAWVRD